MSAPCPQRSTRNPRKIAYLCLQAAREGQASYAHVHEIISGLRRRGVAVDLFDVEYASKHPGVARRAWEFLKVQLRLWPFIAKYDLIYVRSHFATWPTAWLANHVGVPVVQEINGSFEDLYANWPLMRRLRRILEPSIRAQYRWADALITVTSNTALWLNRETGRSDTFVVPNGANTELFHPGAKSSLTIDGPYVCFFGALSVWQGVGLMLEAVRHQAWPAGVSLVIAGDGADRRQVEAAATAGKLKYVGSLPYRSLPGLIANSLAVLVPKVDAAGHATVGLSPLKLYEAMSCGAPVVVTDFPGMSEVVRNAGAGIVIPRGDAGKLAEAVAHIVQRPEEARLLGLSGRSAVEQHHSWDRRAGDTLDVLRSVFSRGDCKLIGVTA